MRGLDRLIIWAILLGMIAWFIALNLGYFRIAGL